MPTSVGEEEPNYKEYFKFSSVEFPDKTLGVGVFAKRSIKEGTCILSEAPLIVASMGTLDDKVAQLDEKSRRTMFSLVDSHIETKGQPKTPVGIFRSNAYPCPGHMESGGSPDFGGLFPVFARVNSSCAPNVSHRYVPGINRRVVYAARDIEAGEELLTCYIDPPYATRDERRQVLQERFRFVCACTVCSRDGGELQTSDANRVLLNQLDDETFEHIRRGRYEEGIAAVERRIDLLHQEGINSPAALVRVCYDAYQACEHGNDKPGAKQWLSRVLEHTKLCDTPQAVNDIQEALGRLG